MENSVRFPRVSVRSQERQNSGDQRRCSATKQHGHITGGLSNPIAVTGKSPDRGKALTNGSAIVGKRRGHDGIMIPESGGKLATVLSLTTSFMYEPMERSSK